MTTNIRNLPPNFKLVVQSVIAPDGKSVHLKTKFIYENANGNLEKIDFSNDIVRNDEQLEINFTYNPINIGGFHASPYIYKTS